MADSTLPDAYVQKFLKSFALAEINAEVDTITSGRFGVRSYPTTLLLNAKGQEIDRLVGYYPPEEFVGGITNALAGIGTLEDLLQRAESHRVSKRITELDRSTGIAATTPSSLLFMKVMAEDPANEKGKSVECL
jgi:thioredoxin-like negative regulator of GroEL